MMTLTGYRFMATGVTVYAFYNGSDRRLRICHMALPPARLYFSRYWYTITVPEHLHAGAEVAILDEQGKERACLLLLNNGRFAVYSTGAALTGRVITAQHKQSILYTALDDEVKAQVE